MAKFYRHWKPQGFTMAKYLDSEPVVDQCIGCKRAFSFVWQDALEVRKCLAFVNPAGKWPGKEEYATRLVTVREMKGTKSVLVEKEIPILEKICPLATHVQLTDIVDTSSKTRSGQQKQR